MKKYFFAFLILGLAFSQSLFAQEQEDTPTYYKQAPKTFSYGLRTGVSTSILLIEPDDSFGTRQIKFGFVAGGFLRYQLSEHFSLQLDAMYAQRGGKYDVNGQIKLDFIDPEFKLIFDTNTQMGKSLNIKWDIFAGFEPSVLVSAKFNDTDIQDSLNKVSFNVLVGSSLYLGRFVLSSNIKLGLNDLSKQLAFDTTEVSLKTVTSQTTIAYRFGGTKK
jgi:hypothetical protein